MTFGNRINMRAELIQQLHNPLDSLELHLPGTALSPLDELRTQMRGVSQLFRPWALALEGF